MDGKTVADMSSLAPDSRGYLGGLDADRKLSSVAAEYCMHPLMVPCWTCLIGKVVVDFGEEQVKEFLSDKNPAAVDALTDHLDSYGDALPPSLNVLMADANVPKRKIVKRPAAAT